MSAEAPVIVLEDVTVGYGGVPLLEGISLEVRRDKITVLLGGSGCGKSTLLRTIVGLLRPMSGKVWLMGEDMYALEDDARQALMRRTGMLFQYGALFSSRTILDNVALPLREHTTLPEPVVRQIVSLKLAQVGLSGLEGRLPGGISGGQRKRVALVRAIALDPEVLFCDEPSAGLDPIAAAGLDHILRQLQEQLHMTLLVVTHELESIRVLADYVVMLGQGRVLAQGRLHEMDEHAEPQVRDFFARKPPEYAGGGEGVRAVWDQLEEQGALEAPRRQR